MLQRFQLPLLLLLLLVALFSGMQVLELRAEEPRRAVVAMEMVLSGQYVVPQIHGWTYYNKPPLFNWVLAFFFWLTGSFDEWVVRLPGVLSVILTAVLIWIFVRKYVSKEAALLASLFFPTMADLLFYGAVNAGEIDLFFTLLMWVEICLIFHFHQQKQYGWMFAASYFIAGLGFLTKGMPVVLFQGITLVAWLGWQRQWRLLLSWQHAGGVLCFLAPVTAYFFAYAKYELVLPFLVNLLKDATQKSVLESSLLDTILGLFRFPFNLLLILLPWSLFLWYAFRRGRLQSVRSQPFVLFLSLFIGANLVIYWLSPDSRNRYLYPFFPAFAVLFAWLFTQFSFWKYTQVLWLVATLTLLRVAYNFTLMPLQQEKLDAGLIYRRHTTNILRITEEAPVYLTDNPAVQMADPSFGPWTLQKIPLTTPPLVPYQLPYYLSKANGAVVQFEPVPRPGQFYLCFSDFADGKNAEILYRFTEKWTNREMVLMRLK